MSISIPKLTLDVKGTNPLNYLKNEKVLIAENCPYIVPDGAPFFVKDIVLSTEAGAIISPSKYRTRGQPYFTDLIAKTGQQVAGFIEITDPTVLENNPYLLMTYRSVGKYYVPRNKVADWIEEIEKAGEGLEYDKIINLPDLFPVNYHMHSAIEEIGDWIELTDYFKMLLGSRLTLHNSIGGMIDAEFNDSLTTLANYRDTWHNAIKAHSTNYNNAHGVTKAMLALGLVENYHTATLTEDLAGTSSTLYSTPLGIRSVITESVSNNISFLENGVFPISYIESTSVRLEDNRTLIVYPWTGVLFNGTLYDMPETVINLNDYVYSSNSPQEQNLVENMVLVAKLEDGHPIWELQPTDTLEEDNYCLAVVRLSIGMNSTTIIDKSSMMPFRIANYEVTDKLSRPGAIIHSSGLPMDEGVYRVQEQYIQDDPYTKR